MSSCTNCGKAYTPGDEACQYCGFVFPFPTDILDHGTLLQNRYMIEQLAHSGGMGYVYLARDTKLNDRFCVVKQVKEPVKSEDELKKLEEEAVEMAKLNHPNVAMIFDHFVEGKFYFLIVEYIKGKTLSEVFEHRGGQLPEDEVITWGITMCEVTSYLHKQGIIHRDISPQNIMLADDGTLKFIDFGTLRELRQIAAGGTAGMGKFGYAPPEQWTGKPEPRSDIFALAATMYFLLTGFLPLSHEYLANEGPQKEDFNPVFPPIREKNAGVSAEMERILQQSLQLEIKLRHASALALGQDLRNLKEVKTPVLNIECKQLDFTDVIAGKKQTKNFSITNVGTDLLTGKITSTTPWLTISPSTLNVATEKQEAAVTADASGRSPGFKDNGVININSNGGTWQIAVTMTTTSLPSRAIQSILHATNRIKWLLLSLAIIAIAIPIAANTIFKPAVLTVETQPIDFVDITPGNMSHSQIITIANTGGGILTGSITSSKDWLIVNPSEIRIVSGEETITMQIESRNLPYGFNDMGEVVVKTNGGEAQIKVAITTTDVIFKDDFTSATSGWTMGSTESGISRYDNNRYRLTTRMAEHIIVGTNTNIGKLTDFILEADAVSLTTDSDTAYGIIFRQQDSNRLDNLYFFQISSTNEKYRLEKLSDGKWSTLKDWTDLAQISSTVQLKLICQGQQIDLYNNNSHLLTVLDDSFQAGSIGLAAASGAEQGADADVAFNNIIIRFIK